MLITVFARKEPCSEGAKGRKDTVIYRDAECKTMFARFPWWQSGCPRKGVKKIMLNCFWWSVDWVAAEPAPGC